MEIKFTIDNPDIKLPEKAHEWDAGFDLHATSKKETDQYIQYGTGVKFAIPKGYVGFLVARSSVTKRDMMLKNSIGIIDATYRGEIMFRFYKVITKETDRSSEIYDTLSGRLIENSYKALEYIKEKNQNVYNVGDKIGQIIFIKLPKIELILSDSLDETDRGEGGFGSTDKKNE